MRRITIVGTCLLTACALSGSVPSVAQAGEYGRCVKLVSKPYAGRFVDKNCTKFASEEEERAGRKNKYEWEPGPGPKPGYTSKGRETVLTPTRGYSITCRKSHGTGKILSNETGEEEVTFEGCLWGEGHLGTRPCENAGGTPGVIKTNRLETTLIDHGERGLTGGEPAEGEVWSEVSAKGEYESVFGPGPWLATFECNTNPYAISGSLSGIQTGDIGAMASKSVLEYGAGKGEQDLEATIFEGERYSLRVALAGPGQTKYEEKGEVMAELCKPKAGGRYAGRAANGECEDEVADPKTEGHYEKV
jgi:hypothetical protein